MNVSGLATFTLPPATRPSPVMALFSCLLISIRNFFANASTIIHPTLWRGRSLPPPRVAGTLVLRAWIAETDDQFHAARRVAEERKSDGSNPHHIKPSAHALGYVD